MPVTAKLSRRFYETFGDEIANELVNWFNQVDATNRSELKDLAESIFVRVDARLEQRLAETKAELRTEMHEGFASLRTEMHDGLGRMRAEMIKWMFGFWVGSVATTAALLLAAVSMLK